MIYPRFIKNQQTNQLLLWHCGTVRCLIRPIRAIEGAIAIDLGIAMQLTNIARDVLTDAQNHRCYLPADWIEHMSPDEIVKASGAQKQLVVNAIERLLQLAESYYVAHHMASKLYLYRIDEQRCCYVSVSNRYGFIVDSAIIKRTCVCPILGKCILAVKAVLRFRHDSVFAYLSMMTLHQPFRQKWPIYWSSKPSTAVQ